MFKVFVENVSSVGRIIPEIIRHGELLKGSSEAHRLDLTFVMMGHPSETLGSLVFPTCGFAIASLRMRARLLARVFTGERNAW